MSESLLSSVSEHDIDTLEDILFEDEFAEDALDFFGVHGLVCACVVGPVDISDREITDAVFNSHTEISPAKIAEANTIITKLRNSISAELSAGRTLELPIYDAEEEYYEEALTNWCAGFVEGFLDHEDKWFSRSHELVAELLLPIMSLSQLFNDEDFSEINNNEKIMEQFQEQLPELMTDLFLFFHSDKK
ncbi:YecA family protein [Alkalimarinus sediminis]|uniref:YecA family protein n=1 Tax=Alkalimarinus sediminis TaxID=1632866 RepID=A0A9E8HLU4_9ALTE|nr:YecA family protein [Alkalimarinus sediminis]UZW76487.1 YecA family protein [Alkalimarinus sediminis]